MEYKTYKGLDKPLVFNGLVGRFIYIGFVGIIVIMIVSLLMAVMVSFLYSMIFLSISGIGLAGYILYNQNKGIYSKKYEKNTVFVFENENKFSLKK